MSLTRYPSDAKIVELKEWSEKFQKSGLTPEVEGNYTGNLSFRSGEGFVITASGLKNKENLADDCFVIVKAYDEQTNTFIVEGKKKPSSESIMHHLIYRACGDVNAVFHGHNDLIVKYAEKLKLPVTEKRVRVRHNRISERGVEGSRKQKSDCFEESWFCFSWHNHERSWRTVISYINPKQNGKHCSSP